MIFGAVIGGLVGGAGLTGTVNYIISGTQGICVRDYPDCHRRYSGRFPD